MTTFCYVAGASPLLTGMLEPSGPVEQGDLRVNWLARPARRGEEDPDAALAFGVAVVDDVGEEEVGGVDIDAGLLGRFADSAAGHGLAVLQVPGRGTQLAVGVAGA